MKKLLAFVSTLLLSLGSLSILLVGHAFAVDRTWTGGGGDANISTAGNWFGGVDPGSGDKLIFPYGTGVTSKSPVDDKSDGFAFSSIEFSGDPAGGEADYTLTGNRILLSGGITVDSTLRIAEPVITDDLMIGADQTIDTGNGQIFLEGIISNGGNLTKNGTGTLFLSGANTFTGSLTVNAGEIIAANPTALGAASAGTTLNDGADIAFDDCDPSVTVAEPFTFTGASSDTTGDFPIPKISAAIDDCSGGGGGYDEPYGINANTAPLTLSGDITLGSDITVGSISPITLTGGLSGAHAFNLVPGYAAVLTVSGSSNTTSTPNGKHTSADFTKTLSDSIPGDSVGVLGNTVITITGTRGDVTVDGGTLKGTGTIGILSLVDGTVAPGMSPGVLNSGDLLFTGGSYQAQLGGTGAGKFDQLNVTGTVGLGSGTTTLDTSLYGSFKPKAGDSFRIINNDGSDAVTGTFKGLAEGATFKVSGYTFKISYKGGTGNDVVITVAAVPPKAPDTGFNLVTQNPIVAVVLLSLVAPGLALVARRSYRLNRR